MRVSDMKIGDEAVIKKVTAEEPIRSRLYAMGITRGNRIKLLDHTLKKQTWEVEIEGTRVALRDEEAKSIEVEK
ncbi:MULTISPECIES: FeoA family protein [unclassified Nitratiruptor]|uniref:FeoA family protein n=1 Tax=unclassified Nitratiruptor TaxID=2624044 RepID=UPI0019159891|nr:MULTISPECIES: FeoA family protein [unclassified Nitratiruptor]BCD60475.1 ferrous iron transport protein A [Nitratiruptor sp. YY08-10]BCD64036.1 ferrous iron transport protein A [Nitratiruptor sp. YY08-14]